MKKLTPEQIDYLIENEEYGADVIESAKNVAVILTQDWCPKWRAMKTYLSNYPDMQVFFIEYNAQGSNPAIMPFKERVFKNGLIPYVRIYKNGELIFADNVIPEDLFVKLMS